MYKRKIRDYVVDAVLYILLGIFAGVPLLGWLFRLATIPVTSELPAGSSETVIVCS